MIPPRRPGENSGIILGDFSSGAFYFPSMILWIIALALLGCVGLVGYYQGALRAAFSFVGLLLAALLASPLGSLLESVVPILGLRNPVVIAFVAPLLAFILILVIFKCGGLALHKKVDTWYKYKASDTQRLLWERMNSRLGIPVGVANGLIYFLAICTLVYALGYLTVQVGTSDQDSWSLRLVNRLNEDLKSTGMDKAVAPFMPSSELYYDGADIVADIFHTPLLQNRLANYPPFLLVGEKAEFKPLSDPGFQGEWIKGMTFGRFVQHEKIKPVIENHDVVTNVLGMLGGDLKDLKVYLETGKSPKYDDEKILGHWAFDYKASFNAARRKKPNMGSAEITRLRKLLTTVFLNATLTATIDNKAILKVPAAGSGKGTTQGNWKSAEGKDLLNISEGSQKLDLEVQVDGRTLVFTKDGFVLVFENTRV
jgi:hypothetical protein